ncbi:YlxQ family RNA-binding protein [Terrilactibacillus sp. S3-3]|nr:YlxQ family RNA-binding protein [Terrilactibacillus sp. S3-3]
MTENKKWQSILGLACRARKIVSGEETVIRTLQNKQAKAVIMARDASGRTQKTVMNKCRYYQVPLLTVESRDLLGEAIGEPSRVLVAVTDIGFAEKIALLLDPSLRG